MLHQLLLSVKHILEISHWKVVKNIGLSFVNNCRLLTLQISAFVNIYAPIASIYLKLITQGANLLPIVVERNSH
jgi:hypothetical protein